MRRSIDALRLRYQIAAERVSLVLLRMLLGEIKAGFRQDQPRDDRGRWNGGSGSTIVTRKDKTGDRRIDSTTDILLDAIDEVVTKVGPGAGALHGTKIHTESARLIRSLDLPGIGSYGVEQSFSASDVVRHGLDESVRTDIVMRDGRTEEAPIMAVWDIKTGNARLDPQRTKELREQLGIDESVPIIELHIGRGVSVKYYICRF